VLLVVEAAESSDLPQVTDKLYGISTYRQRHLHLNPDIQVYILIRVKIMMFNTTFNMISALSWRSVLMAGKKGVSGENHRKSLNFITYYLYHLVL
jgi:hypothetical protein